MKKNFLYIVLLLAFVGFYSCDEDDDASLPEVKKESISMGEGYLSDIYYSLSNGVVSEVPRMNWDIAFSVNAMSSSILINDGASVVLKVYPTTAGWSWTETIDTTGYSEWDALYNSDEEWEGGAFGQNATNHPNYGWGQYNETTHDVEGIAMYIIELINGDFKRIFIQVKSAMGQEYIFKYSDLDGTNEVTETISITGLTENFIYYSLENESLVTNREPDASTWDLLFTQYKDNSINYIVSGVKQNVGVLAIDEDDVLDLTLTNYLESDFDDNLTEIGSDWKDFNMGTYQYEIDEDRVFFVKDKNEDVYKLVFTGFEGSSTGNIMFDLTKL